MFTFTQFELAAIPNETSDFPWVIFADISKH